MKRKKLRDWYLEMLKQAKEKGIVDHYG